MREIWKDDLSQKGRVEATSNGCCKDNDLIKPLSSKGYYYIKIIALICMLIDHIPKTMKVEDTNTIYLGMTAIGRIAFPLFCYELVQCFHFCKNKRTHLAKLFILAMVSEPLFDLAFYKTFCYWEHQNVCFELLIGWLCLYIWNIPLFNRHICWFDNIGNILMKIGLCFPLIIIAEFTHCDYGACGIGLIILFEISYSLWDKEFIGDIISIIIFIILEGLLHQDIYVFIYCFCLADIGIIYHFRYKYIPLKIKPLNKALRLFYAYFYPLHLLVLTGIYYLFK